MELVKRMEVSCNHPSGTQEMFQRGQLFYNALYVMLTKLMLIASMRFVYNVDFISKTYYVFPVYARHIISCLLLHVRSH